MNGTRYDAVVIGAGLLGAATAYRLNAAGLRVAVFDSGAVAGGATGNSFAWLNAVSKEPEPYHRLNAAGMAEYDALEGELGVPLVHRSGCLEWAADAPGRARLAAKVERLRERGYAARWIDGAELVALEPRLRSGVTARAAFYERDGWVDAPRVAEALLDRVRAGGGEIRTPCPVTGFRTAGGRVTALETAAGEVETETVALCAGVGTTALAQALGETIEVDRRPGLLAVTAPVPAGSLGRIIYAPGFHIRPDVGEGLRIGADDVDALTSEDTPPGPPPPWARVLIERAAALLPALAGIPIERVQIGVRPVPADGLTVAGRLPGWENAYVAVTHSGVTMGPLLGRLLAAEMLHGARDALLTPFRPERLAGR